MKCPYCKNELILGELKQYETIADHVLDPNNSNLPFRETFICSNNCEQSQDRFWDSYGDMYGRFWNMAEHKTKFLHEAYESNSRKFQVTLNIARKLYGLAKFVSKFKLVKYPYDLSHRWANFCVDHGIFFGYKI